MNSLARCVRSALAESRFGRNVLPMLRAGVYRPIRRLGRRYVCSSLLNKRAIRRFASRGRHVFFGYYDVTPFSGDGRLLLAMHGPQEDEPPAPGWYLTIGFYDLADEHAEFIPLGRSSTWCWQQGCRLQWTPAHGDRFIVYNCLHNGRYGALVQDICTREIVRRLRRPIYSATPDGTWGFSLNFSRLHRLRPGYGYSNLPDSTVNETAPIDDGIWRINLHTGEVDLIFPLGAAASLSPLESMENAEHYFNHIACNPSGTRLLFFHLWVNRGVRFSRLITCNIDGTSPCALINEGHVSHYAWKSDNQLLAYATHSGAGEGFFLYVDQSDERRRFGRDSLRQDGHPSFSPDGSALLLDTYPDRLREQHVMLYRIDKDEVEWVGAFFSPLQFDITEVRCDLHPRWSPCGKYIALDSACEGKRAIYVLDLGPLL